MKFYTQYERPSIEECPHEEHADEGLVEVAGYRSTEELVNELIQAGQHLQAYREAEYRDDEEIPEDAPAFRMMSELDANLEMKSLKERMDARRKINGDGNIGRDSGRSADGSGSVDKLSESASAEGGKPAEHRADEGKLGS